MIGCNSPWLHVFKLVNYVGHIGFMLQFTTMSANATSCNCVSQCIVGNGMWQIDWRRKTTYQLSGPAQYVLSEIGAQCSYGIC